jgi:hypothetical protein
VEDLVDAIVTNASDMPTTHGDLTLEALQVYGCLRGALSPVLTLADLEPLLRSKPLTQRLSPAGVAAALSQLTDRGFLHVAGEYVVKDRGWLREVRGSVPWCCSVALPRLRRKNTVTFAAWYTRTYLGCSCFGGEHFQEELGTLFSLAPRVWGWPT